MYGAKKQAALSKLTFDPARHIYRHEGFPVPSVTTVIDPLLPYGGLPREVKEQALRRGDLVHRLTALADTGKPWKDDAKETQLEGYIEAWLAFKAAVELNVQDIETRVYHSKLRYAGTLDRTGYFYGGNRLAILEIKTGSLIPEYALQTAAYLAAYNEGRTEKAQDRYAVLLQLDGNYKVVPHDSRTDFDAFVAALTIANWKARN